MGKHHRRPALRSSRQKTSGAEESAFARYDLQLTILPNSELLNEPPNTLERICGAEGSDGGAEGDGNGLVEVQWVVRDGRDCGSWRRNQRGWNDVKLSTWDRLGVSLVAEAVPRLRRIRGLRALAEDASDSLGERRRYRCLVECVISLSCPLVNLTPMEAAVNPLMEQAAIWAVRQTSLLREGTRGESQGSKPIDGGDGGGLAAAGVVSTGGPETRNYNPEMRDLSGVAASSEAPAAAAATPPSSSADDALHDVEQADKRRSTVEFISGEATPGSRPQWVEGTLPASMLQPLQAGDALLLEAPVAFVETFRTDSRFALLSIVSNSMPPRRRTGKDRARLVASVFLTITLVTLPMLAPHVGLLPLAICVTYACVAIQVITLDQAWASINFRVLLAIASSFCLGAALSNTHVSANVATALMATQDAFGSVGFLFIIFVSTSMLSCIVSNSACVVLFYSILRETHVEGLSTRQLMTAMMLGASCAFATPIATQTNLMVVASGNYRFADFKLGVLTLIPGANVAVLVWLCGAG